MNTDNIGSAPLSALQRKARRMPKILNIISIISFAWLCFIGGFYFSAPMEKSSLERIEERDAIHAEALRNHRGFPATLENLKEEKVYFVTATLSNRRTDKTNDFAVIHEVRVVDFDDFRHSQEERFFILPFPLEPDKYYQFFRSGTGKSARAEEYPPPTPR